MTELEISILRLLLQAARDLSEPAETNMEYVRGQAELICDFIGVPMDGKETMMDCISHGLDIDAAINELPLYTSPLA